LSTVITRRGFNELKTQLKQMREIEQPAIRDRISDARDQGDLSENAEYHAAREELSMLMYKITMMEDRIARARIVDEDEIDTNSVRVFTEVRLEDLNRKKEVVFKLVAPEDMNVSEGKISVASPIAKGLIGKKVNEIAEIDVPAGTMRYKVLDIQKYFGE
jgi:transcription elongation factor GreA